MKFNNRILFLVVFILDFTLFFLSSGSLMYAEHQKENSSKQEEAKDYKKRSGMDKATMKRIEQEVIKEASDKNGNVATFLLNTYARKGMYSQAAYGFEIFQRLYPKDYNNLDQLTKCKIYIASGNADLSTECFWQLFFSEKKIPKEEQKDRGKLRESFEWYIYDLLHRIRLTDYYDMSIFIETYSTLMLKKYPNMDKLKREELEAYIEEYKEIRKEKAERRERVIQRIKQINDYLRELEKLLVERDEKKLREFLEKYMTGTIYDRSINIYTGKYFTANYDKVFFIQDNDYIKYLKGTNSEMICVDIKIKTIPNSDKENCPQWSMTLRNGKRIKLYCETTVCFDFNEDKLQIN